MKTLWFDFTNPPHVNFYKPIINHFQDKEYDIICTARNFAETTKLLNINNIKYDIYGKHHGKSKLNKAYGMISREFKLLTNLDHFEISFASNYEAPLLSWLRRKKSLVFDDNDISPNWLYSKFADYVICPQHIDKDAMKKMGIENDKLIFYDGFKEDVYIADYQPDLNFINKFPFKNFVTVRPENLFASYVEPGTNSIVPDLIENLIGAGYNILYLPRYEIDRSYVPQNKRIYIPDEPLNGLDVCHYSSAVLTGAGTFSREAAIMNTPAVSFFAGKTFLGVDKFMFENGMVLHTRNPEEIVDFVKNAEKTPFSNDKSKKVQQKLFDMLDQLIFN